MSDLSFLAPSRLWLLLVPIALAVGYALLQARRRRYAVRFTQLNLLDEVAPDRPGWRRHVTALALLLGVVLAVLAVARPAIASEQAKDRDGIVMLALDVSLSMKSTDVTPDRIDAAKAAAEKFLDTVPKGIAVGLVDFDGSAREAIAPTTDLGAVKRAVERLQLGQGTAIGDAIVTATNSIERTVTERGGSASTTPATTTPGDKPKGTVILLSDGETTKGLATADGAKIAAEKGIPVNTIAFGTPDGTVETPDGQSVKVPVNKPALEDAAKTTGGSFFPAESAAQLNKIYENLGKSVETTTGQTEITDWFTFVALAFVVLAAAGSLLWAGRLP